MESDKEFITLLQACVEKRKTNDSQTFSYVESQREISLYQDILDKARPMPYLKFLADKIFGESEENLSDDLMVSLYLVHNMKDRADNYIQSISTAWEGLSDEKRLQLYYTHLQMTIEENENLFEDFV